MSKSSNDYSSRQPFAFIPEHVLFERVAGEFVLLDLDSGEYFGLDGVGSRLLDLIQCHPNLGEVLEVMLQEYDVEEEKLRIDLAEFLAALVTKGLLVTQDAAN